MCACMYEQYMEERKNVYVCIRKRAFLMGLINRTPVMFVTYVSLCVFSFPNTQLSVYD